jgi:hypothetical protein
MGSDCCPLPRILVAKVMMLISTVGEQGDNETLNTKMHSLSQREAGIVLESHKVPLGASRS